MRFIITFTLFLFFICCTKGNHKNYISNVNADSYPVSSEPLNETIRLGPSLKENLLLDRNVDDSQKLNKSINGESVNNYLRAFTSAYGRHRPSLNKKSMSQEKTKLKHRKMKKKKLNRKIVREQRSNEGHAPIEDRTRKKYVRLFNIGNDISSSSDRSTPYVNDDINYQLNQNKSGIDPKNHFTSYSINGVGGHQLHQRNSKLSLQQHPMPYFNEDDHSKELLSYGNGDKHHPLNLHIRSKGGLYNNLISQIKSNYKKNLKQRKAKKKKNGKKVSRAESSDEIREPLEDTSRKKEINLSSIKNNKSSQNDYSTSYANDDINYQLNHNKSELNLNKYLASYSVNKDGNHLFYQRNSSLKKYSIPIPSADDHNLKKDVMSYGNGDNHHPLNLHIRSKPNIYNYLMSRVKWNNNKKLKQRKMKKKTLNKKISRIESSDEFRKQLEDTSRKGKIYLSQVENNNTNPNVYSTSYVNDDIDYQLKQNKSELNLKNYFASFSVMDGVGNHQLHQLNSTLSFKNYPISYPSGDDHSLNKKIMSNGNVSNYHPLTLHTRSKPSPNKHLMSKVKQNNAKKRNQHKLKKKKNSKKTFRVDSSDELREPLEDTANKLYLPLPNIENNKSSSNDDSTSYGNENDGINYQLNQNKSKLGLENYLMLNPNGPVNQYIRSYPSMKKTRFKSLKRMKQSRMKNKRSRQKMFRADNRDEQPFRDLTRKNYLRFFKVRNSKPQRKRYMLLLSDQNNLNDIGKLQNLKLYKKPHQDYVKPNMKKYSQFSQNAANGNIYYPLQQPDSTMHGDYRYDGPDLSLNLNLFLSTQVMDQDIPQYTTSSDFRNDYINHKSTLKHQLLPFNAKKNKKQYHSEKSALKVDHTFYDKNRPTYNMHLISL